MEAVAQQHRGPVAPEAALPRCAGGRAAASIASRHERAAVGTRLSRPSTHIRMREGMAVGGPRRNGCSASSATIFDAMEELPEAASMPVAPRQICIFGVRRARRGTQRGAHRSRLVKEALDQFRGVFDTLRCERGHAGTSVAACAGRCAGAWPGVATPLAAGPAGIARPVGCRPATGCRAAAEALAGRWPSRCARQRKSWREGVGITARRLDRILSSGAYRAVTWWPALRSARRKRGTRQDERFDPASWSRRSAPGPCGTTRCCAPPR